MPITFEGPMRRFSPRTSRSVDPGDLNEKVNIRLATLHDIPRLIALERACPSAAHWTEQHYRAAIGPAETVPERLVLVAEASPGAREIAGFLVARHVAREWELENIVVGPSLRRKGIGQNLLHALFQRATETNSRSVFLEVRESNDSARRLYESAGFHQTGRRKLYYSEPSEDAILYRCPVPGHLLSGN